MAQKGLVQTSTQLMRRRLSVALRFGVLVAMLVGTSQSLQGAVSEPKAVSSQTSANLRSSSNSLRKRAETRWKMSLSGETFAAEAEQAQTAGFALQMDGRYRLLKTLSFKADIGARLQTGYSQSRFGENTPRSGLDFTEAVIEFQPFKALKVQAGAISNAVHKAPLLVSGRAFPGVSETLKISNDSLGVELRAQQTIPTSSALSTKAVEAEPMPTFMTETLSFNAKLEDLAISAIEARVYGMHYAFSKLPSSVAIESEPHGNSILDLGPNSSRFRFDFEGWVAGTEVEFDFSRALSLKLDGQMIQNLKSEASYQNAQISQATLEIRLPSGIDLKPKAGVFFAESDVAPAFYNSSELGHGNRHGWLAEFKVAFGESGFELGARYVSTQLINPHPLQSRQEYAMLKLETLYGAL